MNKNVARGRSTRDQILQVATRLFAADGYDHTSIEAVLQECGISRGSLYHHFPGKEALFMAVLEALNVRIMRSLAEATAEITDPVAALRASCLAWIRLASDPEIQQIFLTDAPAVLGWQRFREFDERNVLRQIRAAVAAAATAGRLPEQHVDVFAHLVLASVNETAMLVARAPLPAAAMPGARDAFDDFLRRLLG